MNLRSQAYAKWILAGEHAVLRGSPALVFPIYDYKMTLDFTSSSEPLRVEFAGDYGREVKELFFSLCDEGLKLLGVERSILSGNILIRNQIPTGSGLGTSACLAVNFVKWLSHLGQIPKDKIFEAARDLENISHGESSGVDVAAALWGQGLLFYRNGRMTPIDSVWEPYWYLSHSGLRSRTSDCVDKVKNQLQVTPQVGQALDQKMASSVELSLHALSLEQSEGLPLLKKAIDQASECFRQWDLIPEPMDNKMRWLRDSGALATKPTGSGGGGYILSLWAQQPPREIRRELISCHNPREHSSTEGPTL